MGYKKPVMVFMALLVVSLAVVGVACVVEAEFRVSNLTINPSPVAVNQTAEITADLENVGMMEGTYAVTLTVNDEDVETKDIQLSTGETRTVTYHYTPKEAGEFEVRVKVELRGEAGTLNVTAE